MFFFNLRAQKDLLHNDNDTLTQDNPYRHTMDALTYLTNDPSMKPMLNKINFLLQ